MHNAPGNSPAFPDSRLCGFVGAFADLPRVAEGVGERGEVLGDLDEHWKVLQSSSVHGTTQNLNLQRMLIRATPPSTTMYDLVPSRSRC
jgi:hypothetical protein